MKFCPECGRKLEPAEQEAQTGAARSVGLSDDGTIGQEAGQGHMLRRSIATVASRH